MTLCIILLLSTAHPRSWVYASRKPITGSRSFTTCSHLTVEDFGNRNDKRGAATGLLSQDLDSTRPTPALQSAKSQSLGGPPPCFYCLSSHVVCFILSRPDLPPPHHPSHPLIFLTQQVKSRSCVQGHPVPEVARSSRVGPDWKGTEEALSYRKKAERNRRKLGCLGVFKLLSVQLSTRLLVPTPQSWVPDPDNPLWGLYGAT